MTRPYDPTDSIHCEACNDTRVIGGENPEQCVLCPCCRSCGQALSYAVEVHGTNPISAVHEAQFDTAGWCDVGCLRAEIERHASAGSFGAHRHARGSERRLAVISSEEWMGAFDEDTSTGFEATTYQILAKLRAEFAKEAAINALSEIARQDELRRCRTRAGHVRPMGVA